MDKNTARLELFRQAINTQADAEAAEDDKSEDFWSKDESQLKIKLDPSQAPVGAEEEEEPAEPDYAAFKGVKFSE